MTGESLPYLIAFLNSPISKYYFSTNIATSSGVGTTRWLKYTIETLPVPQASSQIKKEIGNLALSDETDSSSCITDRLCELYGFTEEESFFITSFGQ